MDGRQAGLSGWQAMRMESRQTVEAASWAETRWGKHWYEMASRHRKNPGAYKIIEDTEMSAVRFNNSAGTIVMEQSGSGAVKRPGYYRRR